MPEDGARTARQGPRALITQTRARVLMQLVGNARIRLSKRRARNNYASTFLQPFRIVIEYLLDASPFTGLSLFSYELK